MSLTSICCKVMEAVVKDELCSYLLQHGLLTRHQHGFLSRKSVCTQMLECMNDWTTSVKDRKCTDVAYLDFRKAFDSVSHQKLAIKLAGFGVTGALYKLITAFLSDRKQCVVIEGISSSFKPVTSGVPQGSVLGPLLFLLYINDVCSVIPNGTCLKIFADDVKLYAHVDLQVLQVALDKVFEWARTWQLKLCRS